MLSSLNVSGASGARLSLPRIPALSPPLLLGLTAHRWHHQQPVVPRVCNEGAHRAVHGHTWPPCALCVCEKVWEDRRKCLK